MIIIKDDNSSSKEQMRSNMREHMRRNYRGGGNYRSNYRDYSSSNYRTEEAYREGYKHGWEDSEDEDFRRQRDSMGRFV